MPRKLTPKQKAKSITLALPEEFLALCQRDGVAPEQVLRGFIADLSEITNGAASARTDGYSSNGNGSDERRIAAEYYQRVGYPWWRKP